MLPLRYCQAGPMAAKRVLKRLFNPGDRLSQRVVHAGFWAFALRITDRLFGLARTIVLARLLSPNDFGLFGIALLALSALNTFSQTGFQAALVQKKGDIKPYLDTAWTVQVIRGFALAGILFGIAPYVASFFGEPMAVPLLRVLGLSAIFQGLTNIGVVYFQKELEFHKRFIYMFSGTLANLGVAIPAAFILRNAWALVFGLLAAQIIRLTVSYLIHNYRPRPKLETRKAWELSRFGRWIFANSVVIYLNKQGTSIVLGKILGATALGLYQISHRLVYEIHADISKSCIQVLFPTYSAIQSDTNRLRYAFLRSTGSIVALSFPIAGFVFILAPELVTIFLGYKWMSIVPVVKILALAGAIRTLATAVGPYLRGVGRPRSEFLLNGISMGIALTTAFPLSITMGPIGAAIAMLIADAFKAILGLTISLVNLHIGLFKIVREVAPVLTGIGAVVVVVIPIQNVYGQPTPTKTILISLAGILVYIGIQSVWWWTRKQGLINIILTVKGTKRDLAEKTSSEGK